MWGLLIIRLIVTVIVDASRFDGNSEPLGDLSERRSGGHGLRHDNHRNWVCRSCIKY